MAANPSDLIVDFGQLYNAISEVVNDWPENWPLLEDRVMINVAGRWTNIKSVYRDESGTIFIETED